MRTDTQRNDTYRLARLQQKLDFGLWRRLRIPAALDVVFSHVTGSRH